MKHFLLPLFMLFAALPAGAQETYNYLTFEQADGTQCSFELDFLELTFEDGKVKVHAGETQQSFPLSQMSKMFFASEPTSISETAMTGTPFSATIQNGRLSVIGADRQNVSVYTLDGRRVGREGLLPGVYLVKFGEQTVKVAAH